MSVPVVPQLLNTPVAMLPGRAEMVIAEHAARLGIVSLARMDGRQVALGSDPEPYGVAAAYNSDPYDVVEGIACIPIRGSLVQRSGMVRPFCGVTGYDGIRAAFLEALRDRAVSAIVLDVDSPGGEVAGMLDLMDTIAAARGRKPIWSILGENAYSAAYGLVSPSDIITVPRTGGTGSVGIIYAHVDMADAFDNVGIRVTLITDGDLKADGNEYEHLSQRAYDKLKADVTAVGAMFRGAVAKNRQMSANAVRATQAGTFLGAQGVEIGFADAVMAPDAAFRALLSELG